MASVSVRGRTQGWCKAVLCLTFAVLPLAASDIHWGRPVRGLRIGIAADSAVIAPDSMPVFTVAMQNVTGAPLRLPAMTAVPSDDPRWMFRKKDPLAAATFGMRGKSPVPIVTAMAAPLDAPSPFIILAPGATRTLNAVPLVAARYQLERPGDRAELRTELLVPEADSEFAVQFVFANSSPRWEGEPVWTGEARSVALGMKVPKPYAGDQGIAQSFSLSHSDYFIGEPVWLNAWLHNTTKEPLSLRWQAASSRGQCSDFHVTITGPDGRIIAGAANSVPASAFARAGVLLKPSEERSQQILLNLWAPLAQAGEYTVLVERTLAVARDSDIESPVLFTNLAQVRMKREYKITVHNDAAALSQYLAAVESRLNGKPDDAALEEAQALALARLPEAAPMIARMAGQNDSAMQEQALRWLAHYPETIAATPMMAALQSAQTPQLEQLLLALAQEPYLHPAALVPSFVTSQAPTVRSAAIGLCGAARDPDCVPLLLQALNDSEADVRRGTLQALSLIRKPGITRAVVPLLHDTDPRVVIGAAVALARMGRRDGVAYLIRLLKNPKTQQTDGLTAALSQITEMHFGNQAQPWLKWWRDEGHRAWPEADPDPR